MIKEVRNKGKRIYKSNFWKVVAVCFITAIMTGGSTIYLIRNEYNSNNSNLIHQSGILDNKSNSQIVRDFIKSAYKTKDKVDTYLNGTTKGIMLLLLIIFIVLTRLYLDFLMLLMNLFLKIR